MEKSKPIEARPVVRRSGAWSHLFLCHLSMTMINRTFVRFTNVDINYDIQCQFPYFYVFTSRKIKQFKRNSILRIELILIKEIIKGLTWISIICIHAPLFFTGKNCYIVKGTMVHRFFSNKRKNIASAFCNHLGLMFHSSRKMRSYVLKRRGGCAFDHGFTHCNKQFFLIKPCLDVNFI